MCIQLIQFSKCCCLKSLLLIALMSCPDVASVAMVTIRIDKGVQILCGLCIQGFLAKKQWQTLFTAGSLAVIKRELTHLAN